MGSATARVKRSSRSSIRSCSTVSSLSRGGRSPSWNEFDNVYFEICNEPYFGGVTLDWQKKVAEAIAAVEKGLPNKHLIAQNIANGSARIENPDPNVSVFNFHYASPPTAVGENRGLSRPIGFDETGFKGTHDAVYRRQAWEFLLSGGAVFNNLDYSFTVEHPDGTAKVVDPTPGGGGPEFRRQLSFLKKLVDGLDLTKTRPIDARILPPDGSVRPAIGLDDEGKGIRILYAGSGPREVLDQAQAEILQDRMDRARDRRRGQDRANRSPRRRGGDRPQIARVSRGRRAADIGDGRLSLKATRGLLSICRHP